MLRDKIIWVCTVSIRVRRGDKVPVPCERDPGHIFTCSRFRKMIFLPRRVAMKHIAESLSLPLSIAVMTHTSSHDSHLSLRKISISPVALLNWVWVSSCLTVRLHAAIAMVVS